MIKSLDSVTTPSEPITAQIPDIQPAAHEPRPITVTLKSVESVKASTSDPSPESKPDKATPEPPKAIDTSGKSVDTASVSLVSAPATPTTPTSTNKPTHAKRSSVWKWMWPFGGGDSSKPAEASKTDEVAEIPKSTESSEASSTPQTAA